ncbi:MAG: proprotein convertase P-domain-containing protein [Cyanobacteria bacterium P01_G01_bin.38]
MKRVFENDTGVTIDRFQPTDVSSTIEVSGVSGDIQRVTLTLDLLHTYTSDLQISLIAPNSQTVSLVAGKGGNGDNFLQTTFDDVAPVAVAQATPPFTGTFRPEGQLSTFNGLDPNGTWTLRILDTAAQDGGSLNRWTLSLTVTEQVESSFTINVRFLGGLNAAQRSVFDAAAARWSEIIIGDLPSVAVGGDTIDDVLIEARGASIDGPNGILGQAGPTQLRSGSLLPITGTMEFDIGDLARLEVNGGLFNVILHEMGHVLGIGTIWQQKGLLVGRGSPSPTFTGMNAMREFAALIGSPSPTPVPVANTGGAGTRDGHWREAVFGTELMTGFLNPGNNPLSRLTIASLEDLGYAVNYNAATPYALPTALELAIMGLGADSYGHWQCSMCGHNRPGGLRPDVIPASKNVD